jgi:hypothetical protein
MLTIALVIYPLANMAIDPYWQNQPKIMGLSLHCQHCTFVCVLLIFHHMQQLTVFCFHSAEV